MAKPKLSDFKKYLSHLDEQGVRDELLKLFRKLPQVQEFYAQELMSDADRKKVLEGYKKKIYNQFWTRGGNPRVASNAEIRKQIIAFKKISIFPVEQIDLLLFRVETATKWAHTFGGMSEGSYNASYNAFEEAMKLMAEHQLIEHFRARCKELLEFDNLDMWYMEWLEESFEERAGK